jgi:DNA-directed RNA polymerase I subunit RPA43|mmetsp:Transcript_10534/g.39041  ORF Transcript_10534/g.39041 Transcript_10534/m.39041 type:complete len:280 (-) Transcript_10534:43-882(-)
MAAALVAPTRRPATNAVVHTTAMFKLSLHPSACADATTCLQGAVSLLDGMTMRHHDQLGGVLVSYSNPQIEQNQTARIVHMAGYVDVYVTASVKVFKPKVGKTLTGRVNKIGVDFVGLLVMETFNVSIAAIDLPIDFQHNPVDEKNVTSQGGCWESASDGGGHRIGFGTVVTFNVKKISEYDDVVHLIGSLAEDGTGSEEFLFGGIGGDGAGDDAGAFNPEAPGSFEKPKKQPKTPKSEKKEKKEKKPKKEKKEKSGKKRGMEGKEKEGGEKREKKRKK